MAEKTATKKTTTKAATAKAAKDDKPVAKKAAEKTAAPEKATAAKTTTRAAAKTAPKSSGGRTVERETPQQAPRPSAVTTAGKAVTVRKRTAATVQKTKAAPEGEATGWRRFRRKTKVGVVISAKQPKTVIVTVGRMREHPLYKKVIRLRKGFAAHDEAGDVREGDLVRIQESRPYSATKRWKVVEVLSRSGEAGAAAPRVADVEKMLEESEGVAELLARPERDEEQEEEAK
jgi:small subunit ribosomal protein S17